MKIEWKESSTGNRGLGIGPPGSREHQLIEVAEDAMRYHVYLPPVDEPWPQILNQSGFTHTAFERRDGRVKESAREVFDEMAASLVAGSFGTSEAPVISFEVRLEPGTCHALGYSLSVGKAQREAQISPDDAAGYLRRGRAGPSLSAFHRYGQTMIGNGGFEHGKIRRSHVKNSIAAMTGLARRIAMEFAHQHQLPLLVAANGSGKRRTSVQYRCSTEFGSKERHDFYPPCTSSGNIADAINLFTLCRFADAGRKACFTESQIRALAVVINEKNRAPATPKKQRRPSFAPELRMAA